MNFQHGAARVFLFPRLFIMEEIMVTLIETVYNFLWGDLFVLPLPGGGSLPLSILVILLIPTGIYFTIRTRVLPVRLFKDMVGAVLGKKMKKTALCLFCRH